MKKIFDRSPFTWEFVRYYTVLNPVVLVSFEQKSFFKKHFNLLLNERMKQNIMSPSKCDAVVAMSLKCSECNLKNSWKKVID